jgi:hypothetical protein
MIMASVVLIGLGLFLKHVLDEGAQERRRRIELLIANQAKDIEREKIQIETANKALEQASSIRNAGVKELRRMEQESMATNEKIGILKNKIVAEKTEIEHSIKALDSYRINYRNYVRSKAKGEIIEALETLSGVTYKNVSIREVTAIGVQIRHEDGQKRIPYEDLPEAMQIRFQFDKKEKAKALTVELAAKNEEDAFMAAGNGQANEQATKDNLKENDAKQKKINQDIFPKKAMLSALQNDIKSLENERSQALGSKQRVNVGPIDAMIQSKRSKIEALQAEINRLQSGL